MQNLESINSKPLAGKTVTFSFYARKGAGFSGTFFCAIVSGVMTDQSLPASGLGAGSTFFSNLPTLTNTWQKYTYTHTIPSTATQLGIVSDIRLAGLHLHLNMST